MGSKVRLDAVPGVFNLRGYRVAGDPEIPLNEEMRPYCVVGTVSITGHLAVITALHGDLGDRKLWEDLDSVLRARGVTEIHWERHKKGKILLKKRLIK